jgi:hypothetical protein
MISCKKHQLQFLCSCLLHSVYSVLPKEGRNRYLNEDKVLRVLNGLDPGIHDGVL